MKRIYALSTLMVFGAGVASACCPASAGPPVWMRQETAIIIWDAKSKTEHFIRQADFQTQAKDFGFIVPLPSVPDFAVANPRAFETLEGLIPHPRGGYASAGAAGSLEILKEERVGDYIATVLRAADANAMAAWLTKNGFKSRPQMTEWLDYYSRKSWVFAALKYDAKPGAQTQTKAIRISFKTDKPHYPYKMPTDAFRSGWMRPMKLYVISDNPVQARYMEKRSPWHANIEWSGDLPQNRYKDLARDLVLKESDIPQNASVSIFQHGSKADNYDQDLYFETAGPKGDRYIFGAATLVLGAAWLYTRRQRQKMTAG